MPISVKNLPYIRQIPEFGAKLAEALQSIADAHNVVEQQVNGNSGGQPQPPPNINNLKVTGQNGHFNIAITDNSPIYRGVNYWAEHADNPQFTNPVQIDMGGSRNHNEFLGNVTRYWRAYSSYSSSPPSRPAYHGSSSSPAPVFGGGAVGGPSFQASQGSGTGTPGQGISGPGPVPFRSDSGAAPVRSGEPNPKVSSVA